MTPRSVGVRAGLIVGVLLATLGVLTSAASAATGGSAVFNYTGSTQTFTVPAGVSQVQVAANGASGGQGSGGGGSSGAAGGFGALVTSDLAVTPGQQLLVFPGSAGGNATSAGGGSAGQTVLPTSDLKNFRGAGVGGGCEGSEAEGSGGGGGGATVVTAADDSVLMIAAGGGGGGGGGAVVGYDGGAGGAGGPQGGNAGGAGSGLGSGAGGSAGDPSARQNGGVSPALAYGGCGGGGGVGAATGDGGGGGDFGGGGGGGGGSGSSYATPNAVGASGFFTAGGPGNGEVVISWNAPQTTTTLASSANPALVGNVTFTATVNAPPVGEAPSGTVGFYVNGSLDTTVPLNGELIGQASATISLGSGNDTITAIYSGDSVLARSKSAALIEKVVTATATTLAPTSVGPTSAKVSGTVNTGGVAAQAAFQYGTTTSYGSTAGLTSIPAGSGSTTVSATLPSLKPGTTYHYRIEIPGANGAKPVYGADMTFTTSSSSQVSITTTGLPDMVIKQFYSAGLSATGGLSPYHWSLTAGSLPNGLSLNPSTGVISGTPTSAVSAQFTVKVTDSASPAATATRTFTLAAAPPVVQPAVYVANGDSSVSSFALGASGNASPLTAIGGTATGLDGTSAVILDPSGRIYVASYNSDAIAEFSQHATGNAAPVATIAGAATGLATPQALALDPNGRLYVADSAAQTITEYAAGANGDATPVATLSGSNTGLSSPDGLTIDPSGDLWVANFGNNSLTEYAPGASGDAAPVRTITGAATGLDGPQGITIDGSGDLLVANVYADTLTGYPLTATGDAAPSRTITGADTGLDLPEGVDVDTQGNVYVSNSLDSTITEYAPTANGDAAPTHTITGPATGLNSPQLLAVAPPLSILTTTLPAGRRGERYSFTLSAGLGTTPYHWRIVAGRLAPGLYLTPDGTITGTPQRAGRYRFTVKVTDSTRPQMTATQRLSLVIRRAPHHHHRR